MALGGKGESETGEDEWAAWGSLSALGELMFCSPSRSSRVFRLSLTTPRLGRGSGRMRGLSPWTGRRV